MVWTAVNGTERDLWDYVARMESFDYVKRVYEQFNGLAADRAKIYEINAAFSQGRMYFENARSADLGVKPLLLYYGAMALAVGLVSFKQPKKVEGSLKSAHGLKPGDWKRVLHSDVTNVLDLEIRANKGTFRELAGIAWHWHVGNVYGNVRNRETYPEVRNLGSVTFANGNSWIYVTGSHLALEIYRRRLCRHYRGTESASPGYRRANRWQQDAGDSITRSRVRRLLRRA